MDVSCGCIMLREECVDDGLNVLEGVGDDVKDAVKVGRLAFSDGERHCSKTYLALGV